jgi:hypothetical protein
MHTTTGVFGALTLGYRHPNLAPRETSTHHLGAYSGAQTAHKLSFSISPKLFTSPHLGAFLQPPTLKTRILYKPETFSYAPNQCVFIITSLKNHQSL